MAKKELIISLPDGRTLRCGPGKVYAFGGYLRIVHGNGCEQWYWDKKEWEESPEEVIGAVFAAAAEKRAKRMKLQYIVMQQGGSTQEWYTHSSDTLKAAVEFRRSAWKKGSYPTTPIFVMPEEPTMVQIHSFAQEMASAVAAVIQSGMSERRWEETTTIE